jgi:hypothetical protein
MLNKQKQTHKKSFISTLCALTVIPKHSHKRNPVSFLLLSILVYWYCWTHIQEVVHSYLGRDTGSSTFSRSFPRCLQANSWAKTALFQVLLRSLFTNLRII